MKKSRRPPLWLVVAASVALLGLVAAGVAARRSGRVGEGLAGEAAVSASSSALGHFPRDAVTAASGGSAASGWVSSGETVGAWIELAWRAPVQVRRVTLERNALDGPGILAGYLSFGDGSTVAVQLSTTSTTTEVPVAARTVDRLRFTVSGVDPGASDVRLARLRVEDRPQAGDVVTTAGPDGNVAGSAVVSSSDPAAADPAALIDGNASSRVSGRSWVSSSGGSPWVQLTWAAPRELTTIAVAGDRSGSPPSSGRLRFSDGSSLALGGVLPDPVRPTVISFMARTTTSVRLDLDPAPGGASLTIAEVSAYERSAPAYSFAGGGVAGGSSPGPAACDPSPARPSDEMGLVVRCPVVGGAVDASVTLDLAVGPSYSAVDATPWFGAADAVGTTVRGEAAEDGSVSVVLDLRPVPPGPFDVQLRATSTHAAERSVLLQLYRTGVVSAGPSPPAELEGRALVFDEEFDRPLSASRTGADADYAATKPEFNGVSEFGDAPFADPAGEGGPTTVGGQLLRLSANPTDGGGHTGGLVASARTGGSGFSAQYGYFEARMSTPAAAGTWPAFWMLPSPNLVSPQPVVAEIDAVELYGHNPLGACHSTHEFVDGRDGGVARCGMRWTTSREAAAWHVYGVSVGPTLITYFIDGRVVATAPQVRGGDEPLFFLVDMALGGGWPVDLSRVQGRAQLYVDYVRVYV